MGTRAERKEALDNPGYKKGNIILKDQIAQKGDFTLIQFKLSVSVCLCVGVCCMYCSPQNDNLKRGRCECLSCSLRLSMR